MIYSQENNDPEMIQMLKLADKNFKAALYMLKDLKKKMTKKKDQMRNQQRNVSFKKEQVDILELKVQY